jgi:hypothetical protein
MFLYILDGGTIMVKIGLLATARKKEEQPAPAKEFYKSPLFRKTVQYAEQHYDRFYFYNAKDGLLLPDQIMEPYDVSIRTFSISEKREWAKNVVHDLIKLETTVNYQLYLHGGRVYRDFIEPELECNRITYEVPLKGMGIGQQLAWYDEQELLQQKELVLTEK